MFTRISLTIPALFVGLLLSGCAATTRGPVSLGLNADTYEREKSSKAVVLLAINWGRQWNCGGYQNAQLRKLSFARMPATNNVFSDITIEGPPRLLTKPEFVNYAFVVEPGEYALSGFNVKAARSVSEVGGFEGESGKLLENGKAQAGSFKVGVGEVVYIGNFWLDCYQDPMPWRYYTLKDSWPSHLEEYKQQYPFLDTSKVIYRLFQTDHMGKPYELK